MSSRPVVGGGANGAPRKLEVFRVKAGMTHFVRMLSVRYHGLLTHYAKERSWYCSGAACPSDLHKGQRFWKGYVACEVWDDVTELWYPFVLEITESLELDLRGQYQRGQVWKLSRLPQTGKKKTPVVGMLSETRDPKTLPASFDITPVLLHLYHVEALDLTARNPLPDRTMCQPSTGDGPAALATDKEAEAPTAEQWAKLKEFLPNKPTSPHAPPKKPYAGGDC